MKITIRINNKKGEAFKRLVEDKGAVYEEIIDYVLKYQLEPPIAAKEKKEIKRR